MTADAVVPGMSGAPVVRDGDGAVAGVVSGRYNSADGWLAGTVWVARTEDLAALLDGITEVTMSGPPLAGPVDLLLTVTADQVRLTGPGSMCRPAHGGCARAWPRRSTRRGGPGRGSARSSPRRRQAAGWPGSCRWRGRAGCWVSRSCPARSRPSWARCWRAAERAHQPVRLGLAVPPELAGLPWEALPGPDGAGRWRWTRWSACTARPAPAAPRRVPGPLRIVVAIAAPRTAAAAWSTTSGTCAA